MEGPDAFVCMADLHCKRKQEVYQILSKLLPEHMALLSKKNKFLGHRRQNVKL
jgi:hypothetical protein